MDLKSYKIEELEAHLLPLYSNSESILPVSPLRLRSYLKNPRAEPADPVLFELHHKGEMIAYRTLLPDYFYDKNGDSQRFAWLSGNWVRPDMRRKGLSTQLLLVAEEQWQGRLLYTNYAPESKALYDTTGRFKDISKREGKRFYMRSATEELLGCRLGSRKFLHTADLLINNLRGRSLERFRFPRQKVECRIELVHKLDEQLSALVNRLSKSSLFRRDSEIFRWALENPWVAQDGDIPVKYHFSHQANRFENRIYHFFHPDGKSHGVMWLLIHNNRLSVPYLFAECEELYPCMAETAVRTMIDDGCTHTTIRSPELVKKMMEYRKIFLSMREMPQMIYAHENIANLIPEHSQIHDGDGDVMFTG